MTPRDPTLGVQVQAAPGILVLNASRIRAFLDCPRQFFVRWVVGLDGEDTDDHGLAAAGREVHAELHARHQHPDRHDDADAVDPEGSSDAWVLGRARAHAQLCPAGEAEYLGGELDLRWLIVRKRILLTGRVDALWRYDDGTVEVRDYKTGACAEDLDDEPAAWLYLLLAATALEEQSFKVRVAFESLAGDRPHLVSLYGTDEVLRRAYHLILDVAEAIRREQQFPARPSVPVCRHCPHREACPHSVARSDAS